jgi:hypothetical protein
LAHTVTTLEKSDWRARRVGCAFDHPVYGIDLTALCLRKG